jgi:hypothetical protein
MRDSHLGLGVGERRRIDLHLDGRASKERIAADLEHADG